MGIQQLQEGTISPPNQLNKINRKRLNSRFFIEIINCLYFYIIMNDDKQKKETENQKKFSKKEVAEIRKNKNLNSNELVKK